ncbi:hypothetical protein HK104_003619 [Borealophlyctis nickersoniae]|nr:hypothetical protein HK104_003619 [Borealophlyctis nickersoniae]
MKATVVPDFSLPPCIYPSSKPYSGFTTLLHRFGRYERIRNTFIKEQQAAAIAALVASAPASGEEGGDGGEGAKADAPKEEDDQGPQRGINVVPQQQQRMSQSSDMGGDGDSIGAGAEVGHSKDAPSTLDRNNAIDVVSAHLCRAALGEMTDQKVMLTPKQEIKLELARLGAAVEKQLKKAQSSASLGSTSGAASNGGGVGGGIGVGGGTVGGAGVASGQGLGKGAGAAGTKSQTQPPTTSTLPVTASSSSSSSSSSFHPEPVIQILPPHIGGPMSQRYLPIADQERFYFVNQAVRRLETHRRRSLAATPKPETQETHDGGMRDSALVEVENALDVMFKTRFDDQRYQLQTA